MNLILDMILVGILVLGAFLGFKKGFVKSVEKPLKQLVSVGFAGMFARVFAEWAVVPIIGEPIFNGIRDFLYEKCSEFMLGGTSDDIPTLIKAAAALAGVELGPFEGGNSDVLAVLAEEIALPIVNIIAVVISFVLLLIIGRLILALVFAIVNKLFDIGALKVLNKILGCVACVFFAVFTAWGVVALFDFVIGFPSIAETEVVQSFTGGFVYKIFKQLSPLELLFSF